MYIHNYGQVTKLAFTDDICQTTSSRIKVEFKVEVKSK